MMSKKPSKPSGKQSISSLNCDVNVLHTFSILVGGQRSDDGAALLRNFSLDKNRLTESERVAYRASLPAELFKFIHTFQPQCWETSAEAEFNSEMTQIISDNMSEREDARGDSVYRPSQELLDKTVKFYEEIWNRYVRGYSVKGFKETVDLEWGYFLSNVPRILAADYEPTRDDAIHADETRMSISRRQDHLALDVGDKIYCFATTHLLRYSSRAREKWSLRLSDCECFIWLTSFCDYDKSFFENSELNRMHESLTTFEHWINSPFFTEKNILLFFDDTNKFKQEFETSRFLEKFPDFMGYDASMAMDYVLTRFVSLNKNPERQIYTFLLSSIADPIALKWVVAAMEDIKIQQNLKRPSEFGL